MSADEYCACSGMYLPEIVDYVTIDNHMHTRAQCYDLLTGKVFASTGEQQR